MYHKLSIFFSDVVDIERYSKDYKNTIFDDNYDRKKDHNKDYIIYAIYSLLREIEKGSLKRHIGKIDGKEHVRIKRGVQKLKQCMFDNYDSIPEQPREYISLVINIKAVVQEMMKAQPLNKGEFQIPSCLTTPKKAKLCIEEKAQNSYPSSPCPGSSESELPLI
ncbi:4672_t:CDS:2 [Funneliformis mosseae]|uniref:4672_t:CDS:1 n=1 Tax=Funneliformis mosseae TaxID=27381 RepID=A0A9N9F3T9_FUNMO|nr:4672_t:CDS:2 [Funneliformis mosseae]